MLNLRFKRVLRFDPSWPKLRLFRVMWESGPRVGKPEGDFSAKLAASLRPRFFEFRRDWNGWRATALGFELHYQRSWGGIFV